MLLTGLDIHTQGKALGHLDIDVRTKVQLIVIGCRLHIDTILVLPVHLHEIRNAVAATVDGNAILVLGGEGLDDLFQPVGVRVEDGVVS